MNTIIEAGHLYRYPNASESDGFSHEQYLGIQLGLELASSVENPIDYWLFVDDYHGNPLTSEACYEAVLEDLASSEAVQQAVGLFTVAGVEPVVVSELLMTMAAGMLYCWLKKYGTISTDPKKLLDCYGKVNVLTKDEQPTCSLIDAALYLRKIGINKDNKTITVLPLRYQSQQAQVRNILEAFGLKHPPIAVFYHDQTGQVVLSEDWSLGEDYV